MQRFLIVILALGFMGLSSSEVSAQKKKKEVDKLILVLKNDKDAKKRLEAAQELYRIGEVRSSDARPATEVLVELFKKDPDGNVRVAAGNVLRVAEPDATLVLPTVLDILKN